MAEYPTADKMAQEWAYEIQRSNHYVIEIYNRGDTPSIFIPELSYATRSVQIPSVTIDPLELKRGNQTVKVAGGVTVDSGSIVINDFLDHDTERKFELWKTQVYNPRTGKMGRHTTYKKDAKLFLLSPCGDVERVWVLEGVWPTSVEPGEVASDNTDGRTISVTLSVDKCYRQEVYEISAKGGPMDQPCGDQVMPSLGGIEAGDLINNL